MDFHEEDVLKNSQYWQEGACVSLFLTALLGFRPANLFKIDSWTGAFLCAHCEIFKYILFYRTTLVAAFLLSASRSVSYVPRQQFFNLIFSFGRNITLTFSLTYFFIFYFYSYFLTITTLLESLIIQL